MRLFVQMVVMPGCYTLHNVISLKGAMCIQSLYKLIPILRPGWTKGIRQRKLLFEISVFLILGSLSKPRQQTTVFRRQKTALLVLFWRV